MEKIYIWLCSKIYILLVQKINIGWEIFIYNLVQKFNICGERIIYACLKN